MSTEEKVSAPPKDQGAPNESYDWDAAYKRMKESAEAEYPAAWLPTEIGDEIMGIVVDIRASAPTKYGSSPVVVLKQPNEELASIWLLHTVLRREFERAAVQRGEIVLIRYLGKIEQQAQTSKSNYDKYVLAVDRSRDERNFDWREVADRFGDMIDEPGREEDRPLDGAPDDDIPF